MSSPVDRDCNYSEREYNCGVQALFDHLVMFASLHQIRKKIDGYRIDSLQREPGT
jgi:hypothetical protein